MSNRKKVSPGFRDRTTMPSTGVVVGPPPADPGTRKHFVGADHAPTDDEALEMGRALYDAIVTDRAAHARQKPSGS